jgi:hypothetical protein
VGCRLALKDWEISADDVNVTLQLAAALETGILESIPEVSDFPMTREDLTRVIELSRAGQGVRFSAFTAEFTTDLLGTKISLGNVEMEYIAAIPDLNPAELEDLIRSAEDEAEVIVPFRIIEGRGDCVDMRAQGRVGKQD